MASLNFTENELWGESFRPSDGICVEQYMNLSNISESD
jgi:hypothetical protein